MNKPMQKLASLKVAIENARTYVALRLVSMVVVPFLTQLLNSCPNLPKASSLKEPSSSKLGQPSPTTSSTSCINTNTKKKFTSLSAPGLTGSQSTLATEARTQLCQEVSDLETTLAALNSDFHRTNPYNNCQHPLNRWLNSNEDPFAVTVEKKIYNGAAFIIEFSNLKNAMRRDTERFIGSNEFLFGTMF
jgi:hypothetical protein